MVASVLDTDEDLEGPVPLPTRPTAAKPGSPAKVAVLEQRAGRCETLWHPDDAYLPATHLAIMAWLRDSVDEPCPPGYGTLDCTPLTEVEMRPARFGHE